MRNAFAKELVDLAKKDKNVVLLSGDIGNRLFDEFKAAAPDRFYNCGVAEANMMSVASGLALSGMRPVVYTITPFLTVRCLEQIKIDVCYHNVPVVIVGTGSGLSYAELGPTHHSVDDIGMLKLFPNISIVCPGDPIEVREALKAALKHDGPVYIRLGKKGEKVIHTAPPKFTIGKGITISEGKDIALLSTGNMLPAALEVRDALKERGVSAKLVSMHTVKPLDLELLTDLFENFKYIATLEEHYLAGGLGSSIAEILVDRNVTKTRLFRFGLPDRFFSVAGSQEYFRKQCGIDAGSITETIMKRIKQ
jgi:transketolase